MRARPLHWSKLILAIVCLLAPIATAEAGDASLAFETIQPSRIRVGDSALIKVTSMDGYLESVPLPTVPGLTFEVVGRSRGFEFDHGTAVPSSYILIRVTPQFAGLFSIPGLTPQAKSLGLEVVGANDDTNPYALRSHNQFPTPLPVAPAKLPKGIQLQAGGAAFAQLVIPTRDMYVGESVPIDIEVGVRPGIVTSMNGLPTLNGNDFTLNNLSKQPKRREQLIEGSPFLVMSWHSVLAAVKPGDFPLSVETPVSVKLNTLSATDISIASRMGAPFLQSLYNGIAPKDVSIASATSQMKVLPLPAVGRPKDFSGAVGEFQVSSDISPAHASAGDPVTLRLHVTGTGNFDRVDSAMLDHLDHWKTYPPKSSFKPSDTAGYQGEKIFEQPLIAARAGEQTIPALDFSYFNPNTQRYERAQTKPLEVAIASSLADSSLNGLAQAGGPTGPTGPTGPSAGGLHPDHPQQRSSVSDLTPLYFQAPFLAVPTSLALVLAGTLFAVRRHPTRVTSKSAARALAQLEAAARSGDTTAFFAMAKETLLQAFATRWRIAADQITAAELKGRLGHAGDDIERLWSVADEVKYSNYEAAGTDFQHWITLVRNQLHSGERE